VPCLLRKGFLHCWKCRVARRRVLSQGAHLVVASFKLSVFLPNNFGQTFNLLKSDSMPVLGGGLSQAAVLKRLWPLMSRVTRTGILRNPIDLSIASCHRTTAREMLKRRWKPRVFKTQSYGLRRTFLCRTVIFRSLTSSVSRRCASSDPLLLRSSCKRDSWSCFWSRICCFSSNLDRRESTWGANYWLKLVVEAFLTRSRRHKDRTQQKQTNV